MITNQESSIKHLAATVNELSSNLNQANLLDTVYVNENVHSRILRLILEYRQRGHYPLFESFLRISKISTILPTHFVVGSPRFFNERDRIDLLIQDKDYAIIIENKIRNAVDQNRQLERYLQSCINLGYNNNQLFALYLTYDGTKTISKDSLTDQAKEILGFSLNSTGRYVEISFKNDILPWLKESVSFLDKNGFVTIKSAIIQYVDYLEGMFGEREEVSSYNKKIMELFKQNGIESVSEFTTSIEEVNKLSAELIDKRDRICRDLATTYISNPLREYCKKRNIELLFEQYSYDYISLTISLPTLQKSAFRFNTEGDGRNIYGVGNRNVQDGEVLPEATLKRFHDANFKSSHWWPVYKYPIAEYQQYSRPASTDFWEIIVTNNDFVDYVIKSYEEVEELIK